ncbi:MAG TPA: hypothetical protein VKT28_07755 [Puia sp.]|nr:hypothetical protein [Puia sp.]
MANSSINIDFKILGTALRKFVREKAVKANGTIVYKKGNKLIEENPKTSAKKILKEYIHS